jgi:hypothetical protein
VCSWCDAGRDSRRRRFVRGRLGGSHVCSSAARRFYCRRQAPGDPPREVSRQRKPIVCGSAVFTSRLSGRYAALRTTEPAARSETDHNEDRPDGWVAVALWLGNDSPHGARWGTPAPSVTLTVYTHSAATKASENRLRRPRTAQLLLDPDPGAWAAGLAMRAGGDVDGIWWRPLCRSGSVALDHVLTNSRHGHDHNSRERAKGLVRARPAGIEPATVGLEG